MSVKPGRVFSWEYIRHWHVRRVSIKILYDLVGHSILIVYSNFSIYSFLTASSARCHKNLILPSSYLLLSISIHFPISHSCISFICWCTLCHVNLAIVHCIYLVTFNLVRKDSRLSNGFHCSGTGQRDGQCLFIQSLFTSTNNLCSLTINGDKQASSKALIAF